MHSYVSRLRSFCSTSRTVYVACLICLLRLQSFLVPCSFASAEESAAFNLSAVDFRQLLEYPGEIDEGKRKGAISKYPVGWRGHRRLADLLRDGDVEAKGSGEGGKAVGDAPEKQEDKDQEKKSKRRSKAEGHERKDALPGDPGTGAWLSARSHGPIEPPPSHDGNIEQTQKPAGPRAFVASPADAGSDADLDATPPKQPAPPGENAGRVSKENKKRTKRRRKKKRHSDNDTPVLSAAADNAVAAAHALPADNAPPADPFPVEHAAGETRTDPPGTQEANVAGRHGEATDGSSEVGKDVGRVLPPVEEANGSNLKRKEKKRRKKKRHAVEAAQAGAPEVPGVEPGAAAEAPETPGADTGVGGTTSVVDGKTVGASIEPTQDIGSSPTNVDNGEASGSKKPKKRRRKKRDGGNALPADRAPPADPSVSGQAAGEIPVVPPDASDSSAVMGQGAATGGFTGEGNDVDTMPPPVEEANGSNPKREEKKRKKKKRDEREAAQAGAPEMGGVEPGAAAEVPETPGADTGGEGTTSVVDGKTVGASIEPTQDIGSSPTNVDNGEASGSKKPKKRRRKKRDDGNALPADRAPPADPSVSGQAAGEIPVVPPDASDSNAVMGQGAATGGFTEGNDVDTMPPPVEEANGSNPKRKEKKRKKKKRGEREAAQAGAPEVAGVEPGAAAEAPETPSADTGGNGATSVVDGKTVGASIDPTQHVASLSTTAENGEASDLKGKMKRRRKKRNGDHASSADNVLPGHVSVVQQAAPGSHVPADTQDTNPTVEEEPGGGSSQEGTIPGSVPTPRDQDNVKNLEKKRRRKEKRASGASVRPEDALLLAQKTSDMPVTQSGVSEVRPEVGEGQGESQPPRDGAQPGYREKLSWQDTLRQGEVTERRQELTKHRRQHRKQLPVEKGDTPLRRSTEEPRVDLKGQGRLRQEEVEGQPSQQPPVKPKESRGEEVREQQQLQHFGKQDRLPQKASNERTVVGQERQGLLEESPVLREQEQLRKQNQKEAAGPGKRKQDAVIQASKSKKKPSEQSELRSGSRDERKKRKSKPSGQKDGQRRNGSHRLPSSSPETSIESDVPGAAGVGGRSSRQDPPADVVVPLAESSVKSSEGVSAATPATGSDDSRTHREGEEGPKPTKRSRPRTFTKRGRWRHLDNVVPLPLSGEERASSSEWRRRLAELFKHLDSPQTIAPSEWIPVDSWTDFRGLMGALTGAVEDLKQAQAEGPRGFLSREDWLSSQREASSLPLGDDSCFERNVRYSPGSEFLIVWRGVPTATHCQALCKIASPECSFFTFMRNTLFPLWLQGSCFLLRSKTPVQPSKTRSSLVVSGPRSCSPVTPDAPPPDFITTATQTGCAGSPSICDALILPFPLGARFTQSCGPTRGGICANSALGVSCCTECDSSPENPCPDKYCYEFNVDYVDGEELRYVGAGVENRGACESLCRETEGCTHYSYFSSHLLPHHLRGSCSLRHFQETPKERVQISLARFDTPDGGDGAFSLTDRHYRENRSFALFAPLDCPLSSTAQTLSRTSAVRNRKKKSRGDKGKSDNAENLCLEKDTDFWGGDLVSFRGCESVEACRAYCTHTDGCTAFTYVPIKRRCYLKWDAAQKLSVVGHISGPRCCQSSPSPPGTSTAGGPPAMRMSDGHATVTSSACPPPRSNPCLYTGHDYTGYDLEMVPNVISAYKCYELCHNDSLCEVWTHVSYEQLCFLKASGAPHGTLARKFVRDRLVASPAAVTGFSNCDPIYDGRDST